ncbi:hypothetical protein GCM10017673_38530 [Streptosporangium violaceochromogenes]|nr:hypothetical protein GCM10017673_38530 [Streptosporangium violaceochromogenes]
MRREPKPREWEPHRPVDNPTGEAPPPYPRPLPGPARRGQTLTRLCGILPVTQPPDRRETRRGPTPLPLRPVHTPAARLPPVRPRMDAVAACAVAFAAAFTAYRAGRWAGRRESRREIARLAARLDTFTQILRPLAVSLQFGAGRFRLPAEDLATLAILVHHPGPDGERLLAMEADLSQKNR